MATTDLQLDLYPLANYQRLIIAYSGGLDSSVLLHYLAAHRAELPELVAVHINHGLQQQAESWQQHCQQMCDQLDITLQIIHVDAQAVNGESPEEAARNARLQAFKQVVGEGDCLLTAHHQNDQAETVLLQLMRGAGVNGLAAMPVTGQFAKAELHRPLLSYTREQLHSYALQHQLQWIDDHSNSDTRFDRNFVRHQLVPLIQQRWPSAITTLDRVAGHQQEALQLLEDIAEQDWQQCRGNDDQQLIINQVQTLSKPRQMNLFRYWMKRCHVIRPNKAKLNELQNTLLSCRSDAMALVEWSDVAIRRYADHLYLLKQATQQLSEVHWQQFPGPLTLSNGQKLTVQQVDSNGLCVPENASVSVRTRKGGEKIKLAGHQHHHELKKLFQQWRVPYWLREQIPLLYINNDIAAVVGYGIGDKYRAKAGQEGWHVAITS